MFYANKLNFQKRKQKEEDFEFNVFDKLSLDKDDGLLKTGNGKISFNFITDDGALNNGYGFSELKMPLDKVNLDIEQPIKLKGTGVQSLWKLKWYDERNDENKYYLFYFNNENMICYDNIFSSRPVILRIESNFKSVPYVASLRQNGQDALLFSGEGDNLMVVTGSGVERNPKAPKIVSCCCHYGRIFAITASDRGSLIYNDEENILNFDNTKTKDLDFSDERGDLNKIVSFNDYLYIFRDFGITKVSIYGTNNDFAISHLYLSDSYIYPQTVVQGGDNVYFLDRNGIKCFNGSSVKEIPLACENIIRGCNQSNSCAVFFEGKYFLACNGRFDDGEQIGCETYVKGFKNNILLVYDVKTEHVDLVRGVDIHQLLSLNNPYKSKLIACFNNQYFDKIAEIDKSGKIFNNILPKVWESSKTDFGFHGVLKRVKSFTIKTENDCFITIKSERQEKKIKVQGKKDIQIIKSNVLGNEFSVKIESEDASISNFVLKVKKKR